MFGLQKKVNDKSGIANSSNGIGGLFEEMGEYDKAMEYYQRGLAIARKQGKEDRVAIFLGSIGLSLLGVE